MVLTKASTLGQVEPAKLQLHTGLTSRVFLFFQLPSVPGCGTPAPTRLSWPSATSERMGLGKASWPPWAVLESLGDSLRIQLQANQSPSCNDPLKCNVAFCVTMCHHIPSLWPPTQALLSSDPKSYSSQVHNLTEDMKH